MIETDRIYIYKSAIFHRHIHVFEKAYEKTKYK
jgi:hypothetical protein